MCKAHKYRLSFFFLTNYNISKKIILTISIDLLSTRFFILNKTRHIKN